MFTVCPKCALTLVVTAADLRVAQGYVRCGRCSNVFNAIVGLSEDRSGGSAQSNTAATSTIRKAPSISDEPPPDLINDTGENEAVYAEPEIDKDEVSFQDVFVEAPAPETPAPKSTPPGPAAAAAKALTSPAPRSPPAAPTTPAFSDSIPDAALEFNPEETDVSQVFVEASAKKIDLRQITGTFEQPKPESARPAPARQAPAPRDPEDAALEDELRTLAARLDATGKHAALKPEAVATPALLRSDKQGAPKLDASNDDAGNVYSPYNTADSAANVARKVAAGASRRPGARTGAKGKAAAQSGMSDVSAVDDAGASAAAEELTPPPASRKRRLMWIGGAVALCVVLGAQAIHHNRHDLATNARLNRPLTRFYEAIGVPLVPRWNLALYDVRQLGAFSGGGENGNLTVRASLKNTADQPLPLPLLRITVQDRYGNRIATRDVPPKSYVPGVLPKDAHLGVGQRIDAEMTFKDPGRDAVGFEIDACLPTPEGGIACANDTPAAAQR